MQTKESIFEFEIKPVFSQRNSAEPDYISSIAHTKRFLERWTGDRYFREQLPNDPYNVARKYDLKSDPQEIRALWDLELALEMQQRGEPLPPVCKRYQAFVQEKLQYRMEMQTQLCSPDEPRYRVWRQRQIKRTQSQLGISVSSALVHAPVALELSKGCSVGCWFCGVSAPRLEDIFLYTPDNRKLWQEVLEVLKEMLGSCVGRGFCYWASDPLDNPDYELFLIDFHQILGCFPQTTTAQPIKDPNRVRGLLKLSQEKGNRLDRFSLLSLMQLNQVHEEFTAEELTFVELITQNQESTTGKHSAGRAREFYKKKAARNHEQQPNDAYSGTIACVSGFLVNMVDRTVKLISPCNADDRWPLGYRIYQEDTFNDAKSLKILLDHLIANQMSPIVQHSDVINFRRDLKYKKLEKGFQLSSAFLNHRFNNSSPQLQRLVGLIQKGHWSASNIALSLLDEYSIPLHETFHTLNLFLKMGLLDDEPETVIAKDVNAHSL